MLSSAGLFVMAPAGFLHRNPVALFHCGRINLDEIIDFIGSTNRALSVVVGNHLPKHSAEQILRRHT